MKRLIGLMIPCVLGLCGALPFCFAVTNSSAPILMGADVSGTLAISYTIYKNEWGDQVTTMDFGKLVNIGTGTLRSATTSTTGAGAYCVHLTISSPGAPYTITQTGTQLTAGPNKIPTGACTVVPVYVASDNGGQGLPTGAVVGIAGSWVATNKILYTSDPAYSIRTLRFYYSITDDPAAGSSSYVPLDQAGGTYTGTVMFTVTTS